MYIWNADGESSILSAPEPLPVSTCDCNIERGRIVVSFIVIAYNAQRTIRRCIESILAQSVEKEVILVNNNSTDGTADEVCDLPITILFESQRCRGRARNCGLERAKGDYIAFVDADVELPAYWTDRALSLLDACPGAAAVGGPGFSDDNSMTSKALDMFQYGNNSCGGNKYVSSLPTMDTVYRGAVASGFRFAAIWVGEDAEFNFQIIEKGYKLLFSPDLSVCHHHVSTLAQVIPKAYEYGKWFPAPYWLHPRQLTLDAILRILFYPVVLIMMILMFWNAGFAIPAIFFLIAPSLLYCYVNVKYKLTRRPLELITFALVHSMKQHGQMLGIWAGVLQANWRNFRY